MTDAATTITLAAIAAIWVGALVALIAINATGKATALNATQKPAAAKPQKDEYDLARERWIEHNERAREEGCRCGRPGEYARAMYGTIGGIPALIYSCAEHVNVNGWSRSGDGPWVPSGDFDEDSRWVGKPRRVGHCNDQGDNHE